MGADDSNDFWASVAPYTAEFLGTFALVMTAEWGTLTGAEVDWAITAVACVYVALVYACFPISGANFNPAVSFCLGLTNRLEWNKVFGYWIAQVSAGVLAGCLCNLLLWTAVARGLKDMLFDSYPLYYAGGAEFIYTCVLCFVVLNVTQNGWWFKDNMYYGLAIGSVIIAGGYAAGGISGACFNPALSLAYDLTLWNPLTSLQHAGTYSLCQMCGGALAALLFKVVRPKEDEQDQPPPLSRFMAEFLGTYVVVLTVGLNIIMRQKVMAWSSTGALLSMSYALYGAAGSFNPAVTLGVICSGVWKNHWLEIWDAPSLFGAIVTQFIAAICAGVTAGWYCLAPVDSPRWIQIEVGKFASAVEYPLFTALWSEVFFTSILTFVFLAVWNKDGLDVTTPTYFGVAIAFCITAGGFAAAPCSGGVLNPAVAAGISTQGYINTDYGFGHMDRNWTSTLFYWCLAEFCGGIVGALCFRLVYRREYLPKSIIQPVIDLASNKNSQKNDRACGGCAPWGQKNN